MEKQSVYEMLIGEKYFTEEDLRYNTKYGFLLSKLQYSQFLQYKAELLESNTEHFCKLPLITFNSKCCFYVDGLYLEELINKYFKLLVQDIQQYQVPLFERNSDDIVMSRIFSEIDGTANIENIPTTHQRVRQVFSGEADLTDRNDIVIKNMKRAMEFIVNERPAFNRDNLFKLYNILSQDCLDEEDKLPQGACYRNAPVSIHSYQGADSDRIEEMMDSLFAFVNDSANVKRYDLLLPHICHYYILYVHPYFDYNGRTARMVSFWISVIHNIVGSPYFISEAINESKGSYYNAISNSRDTGNDLTFFLGYILESSVKFGYVYKNWEEIKNKLAARGEFLSPSEFVYLKKIIIHNPDGYFNWKMFLSYCRVSMSRQSANKILNRLKNCGVLETSVNKNKEIIYRINQEYVTYRYQD